MGNKDQSQESTIVEFTMAISKQIAQRLRQERQTLGWSLDDLAARSNVSRAMISKIEREVSTPTAALLARLADAMGLTLSSLLFKPQIVEHGVTRLIDQAQWTDPASGYTRRLVSAAGGEGRAEIVAVELPAGARVQFAAAQLVKIQAQLLLLAGQVQLTVGSDTISLQPGDCARLALHLEHGLYNPGNEAARYLVVTQRLDSGAPLNPR
jgi:transcriptional regulator with XRE-family HTH domain